MNQSKVPCECLQQAYDEIYGPNKVEVVGNYGNKKRARFRMYVSRDYDCYQQHGLWRMKEKDEFA